jgi:HTH-type transcriptional regulator/antitoxin HipB
MKNEEIQYGAVKNAKELGRLARAHRKSRALSLEIVGGIGNLGKRFLSEFERGKETAEIGKVIKALNTLGLEVIIQPRYVQGKGNLKASSASVVGIGHVEKVKSKQHGKS